MISIVLIGLSLAMDAAATAAAAALVATCSWRDALRMGLYFGFF